MYRSKENGCCLHGELQKYVLRATYIRITWGSLLKMQISGSQLRFIEWTFMKLGARIHILNELLR